jgi:hypothetical protein
MCTSGPVPDFHRGEAQVSDVKSLSPYASPRPEVRVLTLVSMSSPRAVDQLVQRSARPAGQWRGRGWAPRPARRRSGGLNITDARQSRGIYA